MSASTLGRRALGPSVAAGAVVLLGLACGSASTGAGGAAGGAGGKDAVGGAAGRGNGSSGTAGSGIASGGFVGSGGNKPAVGGGCDAAQKKLPAPELVLSLVDSFQEAWLGSPAIADLDGDGKNEIIVARGNRIVVWNADGKKRWSFVAESVGRIWASPVVADLTGAPGLEVAFSARDHVFVLDQKGQVQPGFPVVWKDELRSLAAADLDGDGKLDLVVSLAKGGGQPDIVAAYRTDGSKVPGFPPNEAGTSGCDDKCYRAGCYDQNLAAGDLDGDGKADLVAPHDNAYASIHKGSGEAFDASPLYSKAKKTPGVRYLHVLAEAAQGYAEDEETALQAHFTNTAPSLADLDGDGRLDIVMLGSVQNAAQSKREQGVALWAVHADASRLEAFPTPLHFPGYLAGLWDYEGTNVVAATNQAAVADVTKSSAGPEIVFAGFDGAIHAVSAKGQELWSYTYTTDPRVLTGGVALGDLDGDGEAEIVFASYSPDKGKAALYLLDSCGREQHRLPLPDRGGMPVPTLGDIDGDGTVEIVVSLKDAENGAPGVLVYRVPGSTPGYLPWPTGRGNLRRSGTASP